MKFCFFLFSSRAGSCFEVRLENIVPSKLFVAFWAFNFVFSGMNLHMAVEAIQTSNKFATNFAFDTVESFAMLVVQMTNKVAQKPISLFADCVVGTWNDGLERKLYLYALTLLPNLFSQIITCFLCCCDSFLRLFYRRSSDSHVIEYVCLPSTYP